MSDGGAESRSKDQKEEAWKQERHTKAKEDEQQVIEEQGRTVSLYHPQCNKSTVSVNATAEMTLAE